MRSVFNTVGTKCAAAFRRKELLAALFMCFSVVLWAVVVNVDDSNIFELEGNPQDDVAIAGDDWAKIGPGGNGGASIAKAFSHDENNASIFTQGGSKDGNGITQWRWTDGSVPDKDDIQNAFAAAYNNNGNLIIYFGADRSANNGDANIGFWFLQGNVGLNPNGTFAGQHVDGDLFVVSGFTSGGQTSEIDVYRWTGDDATGSLSLISQTVGGSGATCVASPSGSHTACAIANTDSIPVPAGWTYNPKSGPAGQYPVATFFEGGLNVTALLGSNTPCFSSFIVETRSSTSLTAQLKDLVRGDFKLCGLDVTKTCGGNGVVNGNGTSIHYSFNGTVKNTGAGILQHVVVVDKAPAGVSNVAFKANGSPVSTVSCPADAPAGSVCAEVAASLNGGVTSNWSVEYDSTATSSQNTASARGSVANSVPGTCASGGTVCTTTDGLATCSATPTNSITISKNCGVPATFPNATLPGTQLVTQGGFAAVKVNFSGTVTNNGQSQLTGITVTDNPAATITVAWPGATGVLAPGASAKYSGTYIPSGLDAGADPLGGVAGRYSFADQIKVTGASAALGSSPGHDVACTGTFNSNAQACGAAACNICPAGATCAGN